MLEQRSAKRNDPMTPLTRVIDHDQKFASLGRILGHARRCAYEIRTRLMDFLDTHAIIHLLHFWLGYSHVTMDIQSYSQPQTFVPLQIMHPKYRRLVFAEHAGQPGLRFGRINCNLVSGNHTLRSVSIQLERKRGEGSRQLLNASMSRVA